MLLAREKVNPDKPDMWSMPPLSAAAWNGHRGVVEILLGREEVNLDRSDDAGRTPVSFELSMPLRGPLRMDFKEW